MQLDPTTLVQVLEGVAENGTSILKACHGCPHMDVIQFVRKIPGILRVRPDKLDVVQRLPLVRLDHAQICPYDMTPGVQLGKFESPQTSSGSDIQGILGILHRSQRKLTVEKVSPNLMLEI